MGQLRNAYKISVGKSEGNMRDVRIILKWIVKKYGVRVWTGFSWLRIGSSDELFETR
jgi:hypothetical protein